MHLNIYNVLMFQLYASAAQILVIELEAVDLMDPNFQEDVQKIFLIGYPSHPISVHFADVFCAAILTICQFVSH